ncbi:MAG: hypothetical protein Kow0062_03350 [Acidobacteriota bacterium]
MTILQARCPAVAACALLAAATLAGAEPPEHWRAEGRRELARSVDAVRAPDWRHARNVILFVGDGMGLTTIDAARILEGQRAGEAGEDHELSFEAFPYLALARTYNTNQQSPDSAGTMTALVTGVKTRAGVLSVGGGVLRGQVDGLAGHSLPTILELAEDRGLATGIVTTTRVTHATPAALYAHVSERNWESDADLSDEARAAGVADIARQLVEQPHGDGPDVVLGGGRCWFLPQGASDAICPGGRRRDGRDLLAAWRERTGGTVVGDASALRAAVDVGASGILGLFTASHMRYEHDRRAEPGGEPSLTAMTDAAIRALARDPDGFLLVVEGGRIDHAHHGTNAFHALDDTIELARAVARARELTDERDTLIVVTADHGHPMTMSGYATRGAAILGLVRGNDIRGLPRLRYDVAADGKPFTILGYNEGRGSRAARPPADPKQVQEPDYRQEATVPLSSGTHSAEDVPVYASGPWAHLFQRTVEQSFVFDAMLAALGWSDATGETSASGSGTPQAPGGPLTAAEALAARFSPVVLVRDTISSLGPLAREPQRVTLDDLVRYHGHPCDGLVVAAAGIAHGLSRLFPDGVVDRTDVIAATNASACYGDVAAYLTGARHRYGSLVVDRKLGDAWILARRSTGEAIRVRLRDGIKPAELPALEARLRAADCPPELIARVQDLQRRFALDVLSRPPADAFDVERLERFPYSSGKPRPDTAKRTCPAP